MESVIVIFLLFFAVLAFAWFYLQRAKARDTGSASAAAASTEAPGASATTEATASEPVEPTSADQG